MRGADPDAGHLDRPDFQRIRINAQIDFTPVPKFGSPVFHGKPLAFVLRLDFPLAGSPEPVALTSPIAIQDVMHPC